MARRQASPRTDSSSGISERTCAKYKDLLHSQKGRVRRGPFLRWHLERASRGDSPGTMLQSNDCA